MKTERVGSAGLVMDRRAGATLASSPSEEFHQLRASATRPRPRHLQIRPDRP